MSRRVSRIGRMSKANDSNSRKLSESALAIQGKAVIDFGENHAKNEIESESTPKDGFWNAGGSSDLQARSFG